MNDMERRKFEDSFQEAFKDAEVSPSDNVWTNIELDLVKAEGDKMKRRLFFFKTLAAASVVFAMCVAGIGYYVFDNNSATEIAQANERGQIKDEPSNTEKINPEANASRRTSDTISSGESLSGAMDQIDKARSNVKDPENAEHWRKGESNEGSVLSNEEKSTERSAGQKGVGTDHLASNINGKTAAESRTVNSQNAQSKNATNSELTSGSVASKVANEKTMNGVNSTREKNTLIEEHRQRTGYLSYAIPESKSLPSFYDPKQPQLKIPKSEAVADPGMLLLAQLADEEKKYANEEKNRKSSKSENLWTAVGFAAGAFSANNPTVTQPAVNSYYAMNTSTQTTATKQSKASGSAYSIGVSLGAKLSERWVLQGGFNYLTQTSDYTANGVVVKDNNYAAPQAESLNAFFDKSTSGRAQTTVAQTYPYNVNNSVRFVSLPVQAGYLIVNKKFGLQLNAGVSTDLFLQNTITPEGGGLTKTTQGRGEDSPYRSLNFSGLMGTEFSYRLGERYRVAVNPGLRYPFSSVYKANTGVDANPLTFDVGLRFRYIFH